MSPETPQPLKATEAPANNQSVLKNLWAIAQGIIVLTGYIAVIGFLVFTQRLKDTVLISYNVNPQQYIVWGVLALFYFVIANVPIIVVFASLLLATGILDVYSLEKTWKLGKGINRGLRYVTHTPLGYILALALVFGIIGATSKPDSLFPVVASSKPRQIAIVFKEDVDPKNWRLTFVTARRTAPLILWDEYADAILVRDETTNTIVEIKDDVIAGIDDESSLPTLAPVATPTPTETAKNG